MTGAAPTVSVVIPTYNHGRYVLATLESVFAQSFRDYEVIVVNDGSSDDTAAVLRPLAAEGRIRYFEQANQGQAAARNRGLAECRGAYVAFLDDDDVWPQDKLRWQVEFLDGHRAAVGVAGGACVDWSETRDAPPPDSFAPVEWSRLFDGNPIRSPGQTLLRADALRNVGGFDPSIWGADDWDLWLRLVKAGELHQGGRVALLYRLHEANASRDHVRMFLNTMTVIERHVRQAGFAERRRLSMRGYRFLARYKGGELRDALRGLARAGRLVAWARLVLKTWRYWTFRVLDPERVRNLVRRPAHGGIGATPGGPPCRA